jgi:Fic family protein
MNLKLETEFSKAPILQEIDAQKKQIDSMRPLPPDVEGRVMQKLRLDWNYNSNAIEGNKLSYGETVAFLMEGITAKGKPLKDHLDIRGHNEAINFLLELVKDERPLSEADIRALHEMILVEPYDVKAQTAEGTSTTKRIIPGVYKTTANHVQTATGETHYYATPEETPAKMRELMEWYYEADINTEIHPVVVAALFHHKFVEIHPFDDGNGRLSRILMNLVLLKKGFPPVVVKMDDRRNYYSLLSRADVGESWPFVEYIIDLLSGALQLFLKAANGESIDESDDIDKEIALFKIGITKDIDLTLKKSPNVVIEVIKKHISVLLRRIFDKSKGFDELFFFAERFVRFRYILNGVQSSKKIKFDINGSFEIPDQDIYALEIHFIFKDFKTSKNMFTVGVELEAYFEQYKYSIFKRQSNGTSIKLIKYYHEGILEDEASLFIKNSVSDLMRQIEERVSKT